MSESFIELYSCWHNFVVFGSLFYRMASIQPFAVCDVVKKLFLLFVRWVCLVMFSLLLCFSLLSSCSSFRDSTYQEQDSLPPGSEPSAEDSATLNGIDLIFQGTDRLSLACLRLAVCSLALAALVSPPPPPIHLCSVVIELTTNWQQFSEVTICYRRSE